MSVELWFLFDIRNWMEFVVIILKITSYDTKIKFIYK